MKSALATLVAGGDLSDAEMTAAMAALVDGEATAAQAGAFLAALAAKGETPEELAAAVRVLRDRAVPLRVDGPVIDTCGTGGDGLGTFNVSTAASFVAAAAGARVAKHGNRAASGSVGAADVLEALGARIELGPEDAVRCLEQTGLAFLFAPAYHPAVRHVVPVRRELGIRTLFNLTGPLTNPAGVRRQVVGLFSLRWLVPVAETLRRLGSEHVLVAHGLDGSDEISAAAPTALAELRGGTITEFEVEPGRFGLAVASAAELRGGSAADNAARMREVLGGGAGGGIHAAVALNGGAALYVAGIAPTLDEGVAAARDVLAAGSALGVLDAFVAATNAGAQAG